MLYAIKSCNSWIFYCAVTNHSFKSWWEFSEVGHLCVVLSWCVLQQHHVQRWQQYLLTFSASNEVDAEPALCSMYHLCLTISCLSCLWIGQVEGHWLSTGIITLRLASKLATNVQIGLKWVSSAVTCCACFELLKCFILFFILFETCILLGHLSQGCG